MTNELFNEKEGAGMMIMNHLKLRRQKEALLFPNSSRPIIDLIQTSFTIFLPKISLGRVYPFEKS